MADTLFWMVSTVMVVMATGAPMANKENAITANAEEGEKMHIVAKRAEEMVYYGNQQNEPRQLPMKKSDSFIHSLLKPSEPVGEVDEGGSMLVHNAVPVEEDLSARAEVGNSPSAEEKMAEAAKMAVEEVEKSAQNGENVAAGDDAEGVEGALDSGEGKDESIVNVVSGDAPIVVEDGVSKENIDDSAADEAEVDLPEAVPASKDAADLPTNSEANDSDEADVENIAEEAVASAEPEVEDDDSDEENGDEADSDVQEFLDELRQEGEVDNKGDDDQDENAYDVKTNNIKNYQMVQGNGEVDPKYYQTMYHILANSYRGGPADDYYNMMVPYYGRRRRSPLQRRDLASIRRSGHVRRMKRGLSSDWLAAYRNFDLPLSSNDMKDSLISDPEDSYEYDQDDDELSRYIYGNLLNKIANSYRGVDADVEEEIPYEEILPYDLDPEVADSLMGEYDPDELMYDPEIPSVYREDPYDEYVPSYEYRKRSGGDYYPDSSRRKRYFYPAYDEPETHWGAFVPEKRNYDDAIQRLQKLAMALSDNPRPYYERFLGDYRKK